MKNRQKNIEIKNKLINHLIVKGKKNKSETIALKSFKTLQIDSKKSSKRLFQLALISNTPIFKINTITQKKQKKNKKQNLYQHLFLAKHLELLLQLNLF